MTYPTSNSYRNSIVTSCINVSDFIPSPQMEFIKAKDVASQNASVVTAAFKAALSYASDKRKSLFIEGGRYAINSTLDVKVPMIGENMRTSSIYMVTSVPALDIWGIPTVGVFLRDLGISYQSLPSFPGASLTTAAVAIRLLYNSVTDNDQLSGVTFKNIFINSCATGIEYKDSLAGGVGVSKGQLYMVNFENIYINDPFYAGIVLRCTQNGSLNINLKHINVDFSTGNRKAGHKGYDLWNMINLTMYNCLCSKAKADDSNSTGYVAKFEAIRSFDLTSFQYERTEILGINDKCPVIIKDCEDLRINLNCQNSLLNSGGASYAVYFDDLTRNIVVNGLKVWATEITTGTLSKIKLANTSDLTYLSVIDGTVRPSECSIDVASAKNVFLHP